MKKRILALILAVLFMVGCGGGSSSSDPVVPQSDPVSDPIPDPDPLPSVEAYFSANPINGSAPLEVSFNETSTGNIDSWLWDFGDGETSTERNPIHIYDFAGHQQNKYTVSLTVTGLDGSDIMERVDYIIINDPGYGYFNPDNAIDLAVKIYTGGEEPFDIMDVPIKNAPIFFRYSIALHKIIPQIIALGEGQGIVYDNFGGRIEWINYKGRDLYLEFYNYYCEDENVEIPGTIGADHIFIYNFNSYDYWFANLGYGSHAVGGGYIKIYKNLSEFVIENMRTTGGIKLEYGNLHGLEVFPQRVRWRFSSSTIFKISNIEFSQGYDENEPDYFIIYNGDAYPRQGYFILKHKYPVSGGVPVGKDSSLKFLIINASSFQVFVDTYSDGIYDWDSGVLNWDEYYN